MCVCVCVCQCSDLTDFANLLRNELMQGYAKDKLLPGTKWRAGVIRRRQNGIRLPRQGKTYSLTDLPALQRNAHEFTPVQYTTGTLALKCARVHRNGGRSRPALFLAAEDVPIARAPAEATDETHSGIA